MTLAKVVGNVVSTVKHPAYQNTKLALVQPVSRAAAAVIVLLWLGLVALVAILILWTIRK